MKTAELNNRIGKIEERMDGLHKSFDDLKANDIYHISLDLQSTKTDVGWLTRFFWIVSTSSVGALVASIFNLVK